MRNLGREAFRAGPRPAPHADLRVRADFSQRLDVAPRLDAGAQHRQDARLPAGEPVRRRGRDGAGPHLCDEAAVEYGTQHAGRRVEQQDRRQMRG
jgi:hypothetical protein